MTAIAKKATWSLDQEVGYLYLSSVADRLGKNATYTV